MVGVVDDGILYVAAHNIGNLRCKPQRANRLIPVLPWALAAAVQPKRRLIVIEAPANPLLSLTDLAHIGDVARRSGALTLLGQLANAATRHCFQNHRRQGFSRLNARSARLALSMYWVADVRIVAAN